MARTKKAAKDGGGKPEDRAGPRGKGQGHWVMMHEPDGGYHRVFIKGPRPAGMKAARPPWKHGAAEGVAGAHARGVGAMSKHGLATRAGKATAAVNRKPGDRLAALKAPASKGGSDDFELGSFSAPKAAPAPKAVSRTAAASPPARPRVQRGTPERLKRAEALRAANPARQQARHDAAEIGKAYQAVSGGKANVRVRLADLREKLPHVPRERQDAALMHLATKKRDAAALYAFDGEHGATARDRAAALRLPTGHTRDFIYLGGPGSSGLTGRFPVAPRPARAAKTLSSLERAKARDPEIVARRKALAGELRSEYRKSSESVKFAADYHRGSPAFQGGASLPEGRYRQDVQKASEQRRRSINVMQTSAAGKSLTDQDRIRIRMEAAATAGYRKGLREIFRSSDKTPAKGRRRTSSKS